MADDAPTTPNKGRRRPSPTIDLSATEVKPEQPAPDPPKAEAAAPLASGPGSFLRYAGIGSALVGGVILTLAVMWFATQMPGNGDTDAALRDRIAALETQSKAVPKAADNTALGELSQRIGRMEQALAKLPANTADPAAGERLAAIENSMKAMGITLAALNRRAEESTAVLTAAREQAEVAAKGYQALQGRLDAFEQSAREAQDKIAQGSGVDSAARRVLAVVALHDAVLRSAPYNAELVVVKNLIADTTALAPLESFASSGVPTEAALAREFNVLVPALMDGTGANAGHAGGFFERLQANAGKLVRVRPVGEPAGDDPSAILARIEVKAARNDVAGIDGELAKLPAKARALTTAWSKKFAARNAALAAARKLAADSAAALGVH